MRQVLEPIEVEEEAGAPRLVRWRGRPWPVQEILERWSWRGRWWKRADLRGEQRSYFLVQCPRGTLEIFRGEEGWVLSRIAD